jgi:hypothetical protein
MAKSCPKSLVALPGSWHRLKADDSGKKALAAIACGHRVHGA